MKTWCCPSSSPIIPTSNGTTAGVATNQAAKHNHAAQERHPEMLAPWKGIRLFVLRGVLAMSTGGELRHASPRGNYQCMERTSKEIGSSLRRSSPNEQLHRTSFSDQARAFCRDCPSPSIPNSTTSPGRRNTGGFNPKPTPGGVPVLTMSPGNKVMNWLM